MKEGSLKAPTRHSLAWQSEDFYDRASLDKELERVFDLCHGCRRCVSLCNSFPTLFDLVDESETMEVDGVKKQDYPTVVEHCYLCDLCYMTKCPYTPPHEWNIDFPHLMLRAKAVYFKQNGSKFRDKLFSNTDTMGKFATIPVVTQLVNKFNNTRPARKVLEKSLGVAAGATLPPYKKLSVKSPTVSGENGQIALFATCYGKYNEPEIVKNLNTVLAHNRIQVKLVTETICCGMPKLELGDLAAAASYKEQNIPKLAKLVEAGYSIIAPVPSCNLMFRQELKLMFPEDEQVIKVAKHVFDPFEYLYKLHKQSRLDTNFKNTLGKVFYHAACHQRVQNIGRKTFDVLSLVPDTKVEMIERCSGHDGTYAIKQEYHDISVKIARPVANRLKRSEADYYGSDCPIAGRHLGHVANLATKPKHPLSLLRMAYGI